MTIASDTVLNNAECVDEIFNNVIKDGLNDIQVEASSVEYDYMMAFDFNTVFEKNQAEHLICRLFSLLLGTSYTTGNSYYKKEVSADNKTVNGVNGKIIYVCKYSVEKIEHDSTVLFILFNVTNPTIKWIDCLHFLFNQVSSDLNFKYSIFGLTMTDGYLQRDDYYKFGFFDWHYIAKEQDRFFLNQIEYSDAKRCAADTIAKIIDKEMKRNTNGELISQINMKSKTYELRQFEISWNPNTFNVLTPFYFIQLYKERVINIKNEQISFQCQNIESNKNIRIEFVHIYESLNRYIFVALQQPDFPRDFKDEYNYNYNYYAFFIEKGNYLTDTLKLRRALINAFGEGTGSNIESEILKQQNK